MNDALNQTFAALADPTRRAILLRLAQGDATVAELQKPFAMTQPAVSKHLKVLEKAGLIAHAKAAQSRPRHLNVTALNEAAAWFEHVRTLWSDSFDRLQEFLDETQPPAEKGSP